MDRTLVICKPDAVERGLVGEIIGRFERKGLKVVAAELRHLDEDTLARHYEEHVGKGFYDELVALGPDLVVACTAPSSRAVPAADLAALARERRMEVETVPDAVDAVRLAVATAEEADLILVTGSFYVLSAARTALGEEDIPDDDVFDS